jgi:hypothetical protein
VGAPIARGQSCAPGGRQAVAELHAAIAQPDMALVVFFCSPDFDLDEVAGAIAHTFAGTPVVGCTTAGEIGPAGCREGSLVGASLSGAEFTAATGGIDRLRDFEAIRAQSLAQDLMQRLESRVAETPEESFALLLVDGASVRKEPLTHALQQQLGAIPLVGGSAGDGLRFGETYVYFDGAFHADAAVVALVRTALPFETVKIQHFVPMDERVVVTAADAAHRIVHEIDGLSAAELYARLVGTDVDDLNPTRFAAEPMVVMIGGTNYVRSIQKANSDGSLTFFSAIEEGLILRTAVGFDLLGNLESALADVRQRLGPPQLVIAFDCILRKLEMVRREIVEPVASAFRRNNAVGFNTYGEQFCGVHVNQTLTGIVIGSADA